MFYHGPGEVYSNQKQLTQPILLGQSEQELVFNIADINQTIESVRLHLISGELPVDISYLKLYGLHVKTGSAGSDTEEILLSFDTAAELQKHSKLEGLTLNNKVLGELFVVDKPDANIELNLPAPIIVDSTSWLQVGISIEYLFGDEYLLARDYFLVNQEKLEQKMRLMQGELLELENAKAALTTYRESPFWGAFVSMHRAYERFVRARETGLINACVKVFQPSWWASRDQNEYEGWRTAKGYENREEQ